MGAALPGLFALAAAIPTRLAFPPYHDEKYYLPLAVAFGQGPTARLIATYNGIPSALGPVVFLVYGLWLRLAGEGLAAARGLSVLLGAVAGVSFAALGRRFAPKSPILLGLALTGLPHFLTSTITFLGEPLSLFSACTGAWLWLRGQEQGKDLELWMSAPLLAVAVNARMPLMALPLSLAVAAVFWSGRRAAIGAALLAVVAQAPCWFLWGGLLPPSQGRGVIEGVSLSPGPHPESLLHLLTVAGFCFWPALCERRAWTRRAAAWILLGLVLYAVFAPDTGPRFAGPLTRLATVRGGVLRPLLPLAFVAGWGLLGILIADVMGRTHPIDTRAMALAAIAGAAIYSASPLAFERYALMFTPFWLVSLAPRLSARPRLWSAWIGVQLAVSVVSIGVVVSQR